ncbi:MAG: glycosyltransferase family 39 protein [Candidatus Roizmanbacteria bacterium]|nr:glycosyltransferase family 39 protein [Candidatus Roizmanbacteria bacterium]
MNKKIVISTLLAITVISFLLTVVNFRIPSPPSFNADEAAFGYNAYSLLKTGKDEYGTFLPLRLKSFGDYKMPLYSYLSVPFIAVMGLTETSTRALNAFLSLLFPLAVFLLTRELFKKDLYGLVAAFFCATSLGLHIVARHAHEAYLAAFLTTTTFYFLLRFLKRQSKLAGLFFSLSLFLMLFAYQTGRLFAGLFFCAAVIYAIQQKKVKKYLPIFLIVIIIIGVFSISDLIYKPERLKSLFFFSSPGVQLTVNELKTEGGIRYLYNPLFVGIREMAFEHFSYFSPQFLLQNGDGNDRFGYKGMGLITPIEYILFFVGIYYLVKKREEWGFVLLFILFLTPLSASLSWSTSSLTRSLFLLIPISTLAGYGAVNLFHSLKKNYYSYLTIGLVVCLFGYLALMQWDFYLFHYPKRLITIHAWQAGYKEVNGYIRENYDSTNHFYITRDIGQPYIFTLFYLQYPPAKYQKEAILSSPDEYGFGQVEKFDKFIFEFKSPSKLQKNDVVIGSRDNFREIEKQYNPIVIAPQGEPMFEIYKKSN